MWESEFPLELAGMYIVYVLTSITYYYIKTTLINLFKGAIAKGDSLGSENKLKAEREDISHERFFTLHWKRAPPVLRAE